MGDEAVHAWSHIHDGRPAVSRLTGSADDLFQRLLQRGIKELISRLLRLFRQHALAAWTHYQTTGLHATAEEADAWLAKLEAGKDAAPPKCHD